VQKDDKNKTNGYLLKCERLPFAGQSVTFSKAKSCLFHRERWIFLLETARNSIENAIEMPF